MVISANEAKALLGQGTTPTISPEEAKSLLASSVPQQPSELEQLKRIAATPGETLLEAGQTLSRIVQGLPGAQPLARGAVGLLPESVRRRLAALQVRGDILPQATPAARIGGALTGGITAGILGGEAGGAALGAEALAPAVKGITEVFPRLAPRAIRAGGAGLFGLAADPEHRLRGLLTGGAIGTTAEALGLTPQAFRAIRRGAGKILAPILPHQEAANILDDLSGGKGIEENTKDLAKDIKKIGNEKIKESGKNFDNIISKAGDESIYDETQPPSKESYRILEKWKRSPIDNYTPTLKDAHEEFMEIPTFDKAHKLQSTLGRIGSDILKNPRSNFQEKDIGRRFLNAHDRLLNDMNIHLKNIDKTGGLSNEYNAARDFHREEVVPYESHKTLFKIVRGDLKNPKGISNIFKFPEGAPEESEEAQNYEKTLKVANDLGQSGKNKILFNEIAGLGKNPQKMVDAFEPRGALDKKGFNEYITPELRERIKNLGTKISRQKLAGLGAGVIAGKFTGLPIAGEALGGVIGRALLPKLLRGIPRVGAKAIQRPSNQIAARNLQLLFRSLLANRANQQTGMQQ